MLISFRFKPSESSERKINKPIGDTLSFQPNITGGWSKLSCYLNQDSEDTVEFELILKQTNLLNWTTEQFIGTITDTSFLPTTNQELTYNLLIGDRWSLLVTISGQCYLTRQSGLPLKPSSLQGSPYVLPIRVRYKNN